MASKFLPPLSTREGLLYPSEGLWVRNVSLDRLAILAKNLDTTESKQALDKLRSVPTPWARLLLFESALYDTDHPAHPEVQAQWRGLLGLLGMADLLGLSGQLRVEAFSLSEQESGDLKRAFQALRPRDTPADEDAEGKWNYFNLITLDGVVLGATSPRTIVFTGMSHVCPPSVPFRSPHGGIGDPTEYFRNDPTMLGVLRQWVGALRAEIGGSKDLQAWLGNRPADPDAEPVSRHTQLDNALERWEKAIGAVPHTTTISMKDSLLPGRFAVVKRVTADIPKDSDLFLLGHRDVIVAFRPARNSFLQDATGRKVVDRPVRIYGGHRAAAGETLPETFNFLPREVKVIADPAALLEDSLVEVEIAFDAVHCLPFEGKYYLLPYRKQITEYFNETDLVSLSAQTKLTRLQGGTTLRLEVKIPLVGGNAVHVYKDYSQENVVKADDYPTQQLAMWPDFICTGPAAGGAAPFEHYFYYASDVKPGGQVEFTPMGEELVSREAPGKGRRRWYMGARPLQGFVGSVGDKRGLLLIRNVSLDAPEKLWRVGIDFGSTHTSVFYREVDSNLNPVPGVNPRTEIQPLLIRPRVKILTQGDEFQLQQNFFFWSASGAVPTAGDGSFPTQLVIPANKYEDYGKSWLPREGQVFLSSLLDIRPSKLETDLKWNADRDDYATRAFLRSLLILVEAEAVAAGARVARVEHSYPTAFPSDLISKHKNEWAGAEECVGVSVSATPISEAVAVCRHLTKEQSAKPTSNTIAFDIGGSTTDIAVWTKNTMVIQESVKMGAGSVGTYIENEDPPLFTTWLGNLLRVPPFNSKLLLPPGGRLSKRDFHAVLNRLAENNLLNQFIDNVKSSSGKDEVKQFLSHVIFLFAAVTYYAGLLTRKAEATTSERLYHLYFCGRGGQLMRWIPRADGLVKEMFLAGLLGPGQTRAAASPDVVSHVSGSPKQEVGRGLLIDLQQLQVQDGQDGGGILTETKETTTAAEEGYEGLKWNDNLTYEKLAAAAGNLPPLDRLKEVNNFVKTFSGSELTKGVAAVLRLGEHFPSVNYEHTLKERLNDNLQRGGSGALIEPLFITEAKALLEALTGRTGLFD